MDIFVIVLKGINWIATIISVAGAYKSYAYYKKSKLLTIYVNTNKALIEIEKMLNKLPEALSATNRSIQNKRGFSLPNTICSIGKELSDSYNAIRSCIPSEYLNEFSSLENFGSFNLQEYINGYISGTALKDNELESDNYNICQAQLKKMQDFLKHKISETEEKIK